MKKVDTIDKLEKDGDWTELHFTIEGELSTTFENAPRALMQISAETQLSTLKLLVPMLHHKNHNNELKTYT